MKYYEEAKYLWQTYVPKSGQAETVQGELIRAIERLKSEAQRNANMNWNKGHEILAKYIEDILMNSNIFNAKEKEKIKMDIKELLDFEYPKTENEIYDRLREKIIEWYFQNKEPILRKKNPNLHM